MTTTFRRDAPAQWAEGIKRSKRVGVRPTGLVAAVLLAVSALVALAVAGWGIKELSILFGVAAIVALAGVVVLTLRGFPLFAILTVIAGAIAWGAATRGRLPDGWFDIGGVLGFIGINLAYVVPLAGSFLSALLLDARRVSRLSIDEAVSGRRWWGKPDDTLPRLKELEAIPSARFFALGEGGCTHLVSAGRRVALFLPTVWPHGEFTMDAAGQVLRGGRLFVPGSEDVDGLAAEVHTWREQLAKVGGSVRGYLVVAPSRGDVSEDLVISVAPGEHLHLVHAHEMADAAGRWLAAEPYRVDLHVMERLLVLAAGNELPEPLPLPRTFAREATAQPEERPAATSPTDAAFAAAVSSPPVSPAPAGLPTVLGGAGEPTAPASTWRPGNGAMRARLSRLAKGAATRGETATDPDLHGAETPEAGFRADADADRTSRLDRDAGGASRSDRVEASDATSHLDRDAGRASRFDRDSGAASRLDRDASRSDRASDAPARGSDDAHGVDNDSFGVSSRGRDPDFGGSSALDRDPEPDGASRLGRDSSTASHFDGEPGPGGASRPDRNSDASARRSEDDNVRGRDESDSSWEARSTRELVGNWDNDSASRLAAWAAEDTSEPGSRASSTRRSWSPMGGDTPAPGERFRWSSEVDDLPATGEAGGSPETGTDSGPGRAAAWRETPAAGSRTPEPVADSWREARTAEPEPWRASEPVAESWRSPEPVVEPSWRDARSSEPVGDAWRASEPVAEPSWRDARSPEPVEPSWGEARTPEPVQGPSWRQAPEPVADSWGKARTPERVDGPSWRQAPEPVADSWRENRAPEPVQEPSWRDARVPEPVADSWRDARAPEPVSEPWRDRRAPEAVAETRAPEPVDDWRAPAREPWGAAPDGARRAAAEWPSPAGESVPRAAERPPVDWLSPESSVPSASERPSVEWRSGAEPSASERPSVEWRSGGASPAPERPSAEWRSGAEPPVSERSSADWRSGAEPSAAERPSVEWRSASERSGDERAGDERQGAAERPSVEWRSPAGRPSVEWRSASEAAGGERPSVAWPSAGGPGAVDEAARDGRGSEQGAPGDSRRRPERERAPFTGGLFDGDAPELEAKPLELRRTWDSDPASRSIRRRDRSQPAAEVEEGGAAGWPRGSDTESVGLGEAVAGNGEPHAVDRGGRATEAWEGRPDGAGRGGPGFVRDGRTTDAWEAGSEAPRRGGRTTDAWQAGSEAAGRGGRTTDAWQTRSEAAGRDGRTTEAWESRGEGVGRGAHADGGREAQAANGAAAGWADAPEPATGWGNEREAVRGPAAWADAPEPAAAWGDAPAAANGPGAGGWTDRSASEEAWWDARAAAEPAAGADGAEKVKKSRWGRNKDKDKDKDPGATQERGGAEESGNEWATESTSRWDRSAPRSEPPAPRNEPGRGDGERIPEQRKRELSAFEDLAPLELNLDEEPKEKTRRFLRRK